jgi:outer membrane protein assembly factor BamB
MCHYVEIGSSKQEIISTMTITFHRSHRHCRSLLAIVVGMFTATAPQAETFAEDGNGRVCRELRRFPAAEAHQAVAVDKTHFFAITNRAVGKYDKSTGKRVEEWQAPAGSPLKHLNSGSVYKGTLYCAHSNWPAIPTKNSVEMWNAETLKHTGRREFNDADGAMTWIDRHDGHWWIAFAFYGDKKTVQRTRLVKLNDRWKIQATWTFPAAVVERFLPFSNSGGSWGPDGLLYVTGHDRAELYALRIPKKGSTLELIDVVPIAAAGQGIAWDRSDIGTIYGIHRKTKAVVVSRLKVRR